MNDATFALFAVSYYLVVIFAFVLLMMAITRFAARHSTAGRYPPEIYGDILFGGNVWLNRVLLGLLVFMCSVLTVILVVSRSIVFVPPVVLYGVLAIVSLIVDRRFRRQRSLREKAYDFGVSRTAIVVSKRIDGGVASIRRIPKMTFRFSCGGQEHETEMSVGSMIYFHFSEGDRVPVRVLDAAIATVVPLLREKQDNAQASVSHPPGAERTD